jgi:hypothetical protein
MVGVGCLGKIIDTRGTEVSARIEVREKAKGEEGRRCFRSQRPGRMRIGERGTRIERNEVQDCCQGMR